MKKGICFLLVLSLLSLGGCGKKEEPRVVTAPVLTEVPETEKMTEAPTVPPTEPPVATEAPTVPTTVETTVPETEEAEAPAEPSAVTGKIVRMDSVNVREGPSVNTKVVRKLHKNDPVAVTEGIVLDSVQWAHVEDGWVCMDYLQMDGPVPAPRGQEPGGMPGVIYHTDTLNVREESSGVAAKTGELNRNDVVVIYEIQNGWGRMDLGWVSMEYVQLQKDNEKLSVTGGDWVPERTPESDLHDFTAPSEGVYMENPVDKYFK